MSRELKQKRKGMTKSMFNTFIQTCDTRSELYRFCLFITSITLSKDASRKEWGFPFYGMQSEVHRALVVGGFFAKQ